MSNGPPLTGLDRISADFRPTLNRYTCQACGGRIVTEDRDEGTTPFMIDCKATKGCPGPMQSACYRGVGIDEPVNFIWRKPTREEYRRAHRLMKQHFDQGGLDIYPNTVHAESANKESGNG